MATQHENNQANVGRTTQPQVMNSTSISSSTLFLGHDAAWWDATVIGSLVLAILVAAAVAVATGGSIFANRREARAAELALKQTQLETDGKVADAKAAGIAAGEKAALAQAAADDAKARLKEAETTIATANARAAEAQEQTAALNIETAQIRAENLRFKQKLAWRTLSNEETNALVSALEPYSGQQIRMASVLGDSEGLLYRREFMKIFEKAGWQFTPNDLSQDVFIDPPIGLQVIINPADVQEDGPDHTIILASAFVLASALFDLKIIPARGVAKDPKVPKGSVLLLVGVKPPSTP